MIKKTVCEWKQQNEDITWSLITALSVLAIPGWTVNISVTASTFAADLVTSSLEPDSGNHDDDGSASNAVMLLSDEADFTATTAELTCITRFNTLMTYPHSP